MALFDAPLRLLPRNTTSLHTMLGAGRQHGLDDTALLAGTDISPADLDRAQVRPEHEFIVARNLLAHLGDQPGLGARTAWHATLGRGGMVALAALVSPTIRDVLSITIRYQSLASVVARYTLDERGEEVHIVVDGDAVPEDVRRYFVARELTLVFVAGKLLDVDVPALRVEVEFDAEDGRTFGSTIPFDRLPVVYAQARNAVVLPRSFLDHRMPQANPITCATLERQCREALQRILRGSRKLSALIGQRLLRDPGRVPSMKEVAAELNVTTRTLRRQLAAEGCSFRGILNDVREAAATDLMSTSTTIETIARRLGYAETANFTHAFTRWHGVSPREYRQSRLRGR